MAKVQSLAAAFVATGCVALVAVAALLASDPIAPPAGRDPIKEKVQAVAPPERQERLFLFDEREAHKDSLMSVFGSMRPLLHDAKGVRFQSRLAVLTKQGIVTLWSPDSKNPVVAPLRHADPIREVGFLDQANLLITTSESSVKVWNALTGELRKEIHGEVMRPLLLAAIGSCAEAGPDPVRFATIDTSGRFVTTWDAATLKQVGTFRPEGAAKLLGAGLTRNGKTLATIGEDRSVTLWVVGENKPLATFHAPSPLVARCFVDDQHWWQQPTVQLDDRFWEIVAPLLPAPTSTKP
jgi:WD40 repeat protein